MVVTRIPPSPTGRLHIGTARTALVNYLFAKQQGGTVIFRSEDTDRARSKKEFEDEILAGLTWLGLTWDAFSRQSERGARYNELLEQLVREGKAYVSHEPRIENQNQFIDVVRLKNPGREITFHDEIRGDITFNTAELHDFVIARAIDDPLYHFAVVVDDMDSGVTHVIRGEDHISNTPRQILIQEALGAERPMYAHLPLILDEKRAKLSKRSGTTVAMADYQAEGFLPEAMVNYLALLGWNPGTSEEYFSLEQLIKTFALEGVQKGGASWDRTKLLSVNQHWMRKLSDEEYLTRGNLQAGDATMLHKVAPLLKERAQTFTQAREMLTGELKSFFEAPVLDKNLLIAKEPADRPGLTKTALESLIEPINGLQVGAAVEEVKAVLMPLADAEEVKGKGGRGGVLWPLRYALSGQERSPDPFTLIALLGKDEVIKRIEKAIGILE
jgi:glutamyl-tRNA synthetase